MKQILYIAFLIHVKVLVCNCPNKQELVGELESLYPSIQKIVL